MGVDKRLRGKMLAAFQNHLLALHSTGMPFEMCAAYALQWLRQRGIEPTIPNMQAGFDVFDDDCPAH